MAGAVIGKDGALGSPFVRGRGGGLLGVWQLDEAAFFEPAAGGEEGDFYAGDGGEGVDSFAVGFADAVVGDDENAQGRRGAHGWDSASTLSRAAVRAVRRASCWGPRAYWAALRSG